LALWLGLLGFLAALSPTPALRAADGVIIAEFLASNTSGLQDENGDNSDWIELFNAGTVPVNLAGWALTDSAADPTKWIFPSTNIAPGGFLIVFASGKDRRVPGAPLHTRFSLSAGGEYLGLIRPDGSQRTVLTAADSVLINGMPPSTVTVSETAPTGRVKANARAS